MQTAVTAATALAAANVASAAATAVVNSATARAVARSAETVRLKNVVAAEALAAKTLAAATAVAKAAVTAAAGVTALVASDIRVAAAQAAFFIAKNGQPPEATQTAADLIPKSANQTAADLASAIAAQARYEEVDAVTQEIVSQAAAAAANHAVLTSTIRVNSLEKQAVCYYEGRRALTYAFTQMQEEAASTLLATQQAADDEAVRVASSASRIAREVLCT